MLQIKPIHFAFMSTFLIFVLATAVFIVVWGLKSNPRPKEIGEFDFENTRTKVYQAGDCQIFATKWKNNDDPRFFFSCARN